MASEQHVPGSLNSDTIASQSRAGILRQCIGICLLAAYPPASAAPRVPWLAEPEYERISSGGTYHSDSATEATKE